MEECKGDEQQPTPALTSASATSTVVGDTVVFPPRQLVDFILHYEGVDFQVHRFALYYHLSYFRTQFDTGVLPLPLGRHFLKQTKRCNHPLIVHCCHLSQQATLVDKWDTTAASFRLFSTNSTLLRTTATHPSCRRRTSTSLFYQQYLSLSIPSQ